MMLENIELLIEYRNMPVEIIFDVLTKSNNYGLLSFIPDMDKKIKTGIDLSKTFEQCLYNSEAKKTFDSEDLTFLRSFFSMLGKSDLTGQLSNCKLHKEFLKNKLIKLESEEKMKCKSSGTLIIGIGVLFSIIII